MKKNIRTEKKRSKEQASKDRTVVILEDIRSQFMSFGEGLSVVSNKVDGLEDGQKILTEKVCTLEDGQKISFGKLNNLEKGQKILSNKVDSLEKGQKILTEKVCTLEDGQKILTEKVCTLEDGQKISFGKLNNLETKIDKIDERLIRVEDDVVEIKHKLSEKVDREDFQKLEMRLVKLEKIVFEKI